jgi:hypothetical protein
MGAAPSIGRAAEPRTGIECLPGRRASPGLVRPQTDAGLGPCRFWQDDLGERMAPKQAGSDPDAATRLALPGRGRQRSRAIPGLRRRRFAGAQAGPGRRGAGCVPQPAAATDRSPAGGPDQRTGRPARSGSPGPRRLPPGRGAADPRHARLSARTPASPDAPGHRHPRRSAPAPGPPARPGTVDRSAGCRPALHPGRGSGLSQPDDGPGPRRGGHLRPGVPYRGLDRRSTTGRPVDGEAEAGRLPRRQTSASRRATPSWP